MQVWTIIVAAGSGSRFGGAKQFALLRGQRVIDRSIAAARAASAGVVVVTSPDHLNTVQSSVEVHTVVAGGDSRSASVRAGLMAVPADADVIVVHDAARPLATPELYATVVAAIEAGADAAVPGVAVVDTIKRVDHSGKVLETVDRSELVAVQTPQAFNARTLRRAHDAAPEASDDAGLIEALGGHVVVVPGLPQNFKITVPTDLVTMEAMMTND